jgi:hypothetical protein
VGVKEEACILHLAPTSSTTAQIAMGDALAVSLMQMRGFTSVDFARLHPGGSLGRRLLMTVGNVMRDHDLPVVAPDCLSAEMKKAHLQTHGCVFTQPRAVASLGLQRSIMIAYTCLTLVALS